MDHSTRNFRFLSGFPVAVILSFFLIQNAVADINGRAGRSGLTGSTCTGCHTAGAAVPTVAFTAGPTSVAAGSVNNFTVAISGGPAMNGSIDVAANGGTLAATGAGTKLLSGEVVHSAPKPFSGGSAAFDFSWTAPATSGTYTLFVAGMSDNGNGNDGAGDGTALITRVITVTGGANALPVARISAPATGSAGVPVNFSGALSTDADGTIASYAWNFGDGTSGAGVSTTHSYTAGTYTVGLTVTDNMGDTGAVSQQIVIGGTTTPVTSANPGGPYSGMPGIAVQFSGAASTGSIASYVWNFGDGTTGSGVSPAHVYATSGTFQVTLTVTDTSGVVNASRTTVTIGATAADPSAGEALYEENCSGCHGDGGAGGSIFGESAGDIAEAFAEIADHADVAAILTEEDIAAIAEFLNGGSSAGEDLYNENCAECHGEGGVGGEDGDVLGASAEDIEEAIEEYEEMNFLEDVLSEEDIAAIAEYLNRCEEEDDEEEEEEESFIASLLGTLSDDDEDDEGGTCVAGGGFTALGDGSKANAKPPKSHAPAAKAAAVSTGTFSGLELFALAGAGLMWAGRRRKK